MSSSVNLCGVAHSASDIIAQTVKGSHVLKIHGYSWIKRFSNGKSVESESFDIGGHRWYIRYYPDGYNAEDAGWISLYLCLDLDHSNAASAEASFVFTLLDDAGEPVMSYGLSGVEINTYTPNDNGWPGWGFQKFIERNALEEPNRLKDDCFRVRCEVTVLTMIRTEATSQIVKVPPSDMTKHISRLLSSGVEGDITFQVGEEKFAAHRLVLAARSSVFKAQLYGPMKEKSTSHVHIDDMEPRVFRAMLHFIYNDALPEIENSDTFAMAQHLLVAADRYDLERLKLICEHKLCDCINTSMAITTLVLAEQHGCKVLQEACLRFLRSPSNLKKVMDSDEFKHLTSSRPSLLNELLANFCTLA